MGNNQTSFGRIALFYKADLFTFAKSILTFSGIMFLVFILLPRLGLLWGESYSTWAEAYAYRYEITFFSYLSTLAFAYGIYVQYYLHSRLHRGEPMPFSLLPAKLWEKLVGMFLTSLTIYLASVATLLLIYLFDFLTLPSLEFSLWEFIVDWTDGVARFFVEEMPYEVSLLGAFTAVSSIGIMFFILIKVKRFTWALFIEMISMVGLILSFFYMLLALFVEPNKTLMDDATGRGILLRSTLIYWLPIAIISLWASYRQLRKISS